MKKRCILLEECRFGAVILWYEPVEPDKPEDAQTYVRIFRSETDNHCVAMVHIHMVIPIPDEVKPERRWGAWYPEQSWLNSVLPLWREPYQQRRHFS
ncbi:hypothetical protein [Intestinimonas sp. HCP28S3_D6]|uniref:hypothetical protein n=1 Tax=Intestinimonas sp. HCP28S3_D6 TaxID=3438942 RepID=UPI003F89FBBE